MKEIKEKISSSQYEALKKVNSELISLYWATGKDIVSQQQEHGWTHNVVVFQKSKDSLEREFYIKMTKKFCWTYRVLTQQIDNKRFCLLLKR